MASLVVRAAEAAPQPHAPRYRASASHAEGCVEGIEHFRASRSLRVQSKNRPPLVSLSISMFATRAVSVVCVAVAVAHATFRRGGSAYAGKRLGSASPWTPHICQAIAPSTGLASNFRSPGEGYP
mgnify:CR=1 FL=1